MTTIERVLFLQGVEAFRGVTTEQLGFIATIAKEVTVDAGYVLYREGDPPDGLYVLISGTVALTRGREVIERIRSNGSFGAWALFDDQPRLARAEAAEACRLLFVPRADFYDVLSDHSDITQGIFKQLVQRVRRLAESASR